jgi:hypothetical protein
MITQMRGHTQCEARREPRTNMFVMATIYADTGSAPVKVRNLSSSGALVEGGVLPPPGATFRLCRGSLNITGEVVWSRDGRAGLRFASGVSVADWLPRGKATAPQQRVDDIVQYAKASLIPTSISPEDCPIFETNKLSSLDMTRLRQAIESLAEDLANDPLIVERHASKLQTLDIAAQALRKLAAER